MQKPKRRANLKWWKDAKFGLFIHWGPSSVGGATIQGDALYLHIFHWVEGALTLPALPRKVLSYVELGGESVTCTQSADRLVVKLDSAKATDLHSVVKLALEPGDPIPVIAVESDAEENRL